MAESGQAVSQGDTLQPGIGGNGLFQARGGRNGFVWPQRPMAAMPAPRRARMPLQSHMVRQWNPKAASSQVGTAVVTPLTDSAPSGTLDWDARPTALAIAIRPPIARSRG